ncbi:MAG: hypothetical protein DRP83_02385 [Planctomycetota bacterium]|nr:MAG: hypothetical protein DRP83_02385 [Planctomycetota bacterium]
MNLTRHDEDVLREKAHELRTQYEDDQEYLRIADELDKAADSGSTAQAAWAASLLVQKNRKVAPDFRVRRFLNG